MKTETVYITCDICNANDADELRFGVMGREYAVDLCTTCRSIFDNLMDDYVSNGRKVVYRNHVVRKDAPQRISTLHGDKPVNKPVQKRNNRKQQKSPPPGELSN